MFRNYFTTALRSFWRNKVFSFINVLGLAVGISASLVIFLIVHHEFSFESFQKDKDKVYRVVSDMHFPDQEFKNSGVPLPLPPELNQSSWVHSLTDRVRLGACERDAHVLARAANCSKYPPRTR